MKIQWLLIASLLLVSLVSEADFSSDAKNSDFSNVGQTSPAVSQEAGTQAASTTTSVGSDVKSIQEATTSINDLVSSSFGAPVDTQSCTSAANSAKNMCIVSLNSGMQKAAATMGLVMSGAALLSNLTSACSKFGDALKVGQIALSAYNSMCGMAQQSCDSACTAVQSQITKALETPDPGTKSNLLKIQASVGKVLAKCQGYKMNIAAAATGMTTLVASSALAGQCKKETAATDCASNPFSAACATKALDCSLAENASNTTCICQKAPNTPGCAGYVSSNGNTMNMSSDGTDKADIGNTALNAPNSTAGTDVTPVSPTSGGNGVAPSGGGGGTGGLSGGGADGKSKQEKAKGLNPNILSGYDGGSGGGYRGGSGSGRNSELQAYLPNGAKDPARNPAAQLFGGGQVTSAGAKSNFEKINERYSETMPGK